MEKASLLIVNHLDHTISTPINNANIILVCLHTIRHEPLENRRTQPFLFNNYIQLPPQNALSFHVHGLHVIDHNCHDLMINRVINHTRHGHPSLNTLYVIKHHPHILLIIIHLYSLDHIKFKHSSINGHLEQINFVLSPLTKKPIVFNIIITK